MAAGWDWDRSIGQLFGGTMNRRLDGDIPYSVRIDLSTGKVILVLGKDLDNPEVQVEFIPAAAKSLGEKLLEAHHILAD